ncbi:septal ring lytic transglycosylase RlpA family protein [Paenalcaligenes niemegkensis]|uniref:septal ring lytic transglycosylase RlpA family protein n=1 Tax=Paenalcaligenes niemegkensis TaxID=2895469 RepID=UPI00356AB759
MVWKKFHGRKTANGEIYDMYAMTAAHPTLPLPSYAKVTRPGTGQSVVVRINDRGPFHRARIIDLSYVAAAKLGLINSGKGSVVVEAITNEDIRSGRFQDSASAAVVDVEPPRSGPGQAAPEEVPDALEMLAKTQLENAMNDTPSWSSDADSQRLVVEEIGPAPRPAC